jgi:nucleotide-binding universal stress UspA family protein
MFQRILFPVDISDLKAESLQRACEIAKSFGGKLFFLHVQPYPPIPMQDNGALMSSVTLTEDYLMATSDEHPSPQILLDAVFGTYQPIKNFDCEYAIERGELAETVAEYAKAQKIDLVITEHRHVHGIFHWLFRSSDETILGKVDVPVLVLPR